MVLEVLSHYGRQHPLVLLFGIFAAWKSLIILIALSSPGIGYDTSTSLRSFKNDTLPVVSDVPATFNHNWLNFVRWDAIYFTHLAEQGHVFEQEWAFGVGLSTAISWIATRKSIVHIDRVKAD